jgi:hypothetical protein
MRRDLMQKKLKREGWKGGGGVVVERGRGRWNKQVRGARLGGTSEEGEEIPASFCPLVMGNREGMGMCGWGHVHTAGLPNN